MGAEVAKRNTMPAVALSWARQDVEQRLGFQGGMHTRVNTFLSLLLGLVLTAGFYVVLLLFPEWWISVKLLQPVPFFIVFFSMWAVMILLLKSRKLALQKRALDLVVVPTDHDFVLSSATVDVVMEAIYSAVDDPKRFVLFNRIVIALSNLRNLGRVSDVDDILRSRASNDESAMETSYSVVSSLIWAIPVLGFIGTVIGLSVAIGEFTGVLQAATDLSQIKDELKQVTAGLAYAFETTLEALVAALCIQFMMTFLKKAEEEFLDACSDYCVRHVVNRLRIMPYERQAD
jgi:biopolymer transport protein ExbB/TolQ